MDSRISELTPADALSGTELIPLTQGGVTKSTSAASIAALAPAGGGALPMQLPIDDGTGRARYGCGFPYPFLSTEHDGSSPADGGWALASDTIYAFPMAVAADVTASTIGVDVDFIQATGGAKWGIYDAGTDFKPNHLLASATSATAFTSGGTNEAALSITLEGGKLYWFAIMAGTNLCRAKTFFPQFILGGQAYQTAFVGLRKTSQPYATGLPATWTGGELVSDGQDGTIAIWVK